MKCNSSALPSVAPRSAADRRLSPFLGPPVGPELGERLLSSISPGLAMSGCHHQPPSHLSFSLALMPVSASLGSALALFVLLVCFANAGPSAPALAARADATVYYAVRPLPY